MKALFITLFLAPLLSMAQDCRSYYYMVDNSAVEMTVYDKKGEASGKQTWKISNVKKNASGFESQVNSSFTDEKGKEVSSSSGTYKCENGVLMADVRMSMPQEQMKAYEGAEAKFENTYIEYPSSPKEGQALADVDFQMEISGKNGATTTISFQQTNRKVVSKEPVTTAAGTWEAYVITSDVSFRTQVGPIGIPFHLKMKEWFVPNFGIVKTESYNKKGKLVGSTQLSSVQK